MSGVTAAQVVRAIDELIAENEQLKLKLGEFLEYVGMPQRVLVGVPDNKPKLTRREVDQMRQMKRNTNLSSRALASVFDVNPSTVTRIISGQYHK